jgi:hypothetical protein
MVSRVGIVIVMAALGLGFPANVRADAILHVSLNTAGLSVAPGSSSGPFSLAFQLTDGSGIGDANNTVTLSDFNFGGGGLLAGTTLSDGGVAGDPATALTLTDSTFFSYYLQGFVPGSFLSFVLSTTTNLNGIGGAPDAFAFSILDGFGAPIPTLDPLFTDTLLTLTIDSSTPSFAVYGSDLARTDLALNAPDVAPVPEPSTLLLLATGLGAARLARRRRGRQTPA